MAKELNPMAFSWINREANLAAHYLAQWVNAQSSPDKSMNVTKKHTLKCIMYNCIYLLKLATGSSGSALRSLWKQLMNRHWRCIVFEVI